MTCLERSNYKGLSPLRLELGEHGLVLKRLKFDKILMAAQRFVSSTCTCVGGRPLPGGKPGNVNHWEALSETPG